MEVEVLDILVFNLGSPGFTSVRWADVNFFDVERKFPDWWDNNDYQVGSCHTHHNMTNWFSGTDEQDLCEAAESYYKDAFISLIVDHRGDYSARIAYTTNPADHNLWQGKHMVAEFNTPTLFWADFDVEFEFNNKDNINVQLVDSLKVTLAANQKIQREAKLAEKMSKKFVSLIKSDFFGMDFEWTSENVEKVLETNGGIDRICDDIKEHMLPTVINYLEQEEHPYEAVYRSVDSAEEVTKDLFALWCLEMKQNKIANEYRNKLFKAMVATGGIN